MSPTAGWARRPWLAAAMLWPLLVAAFHWQAARPGMALAGWDLRNFFFSIRDATAAALREGRLPGWQRGIFLGYPLLGDPQAATFDLATWLTLPWDTPRALTLGALLHLALAGWGMLWWMRLRGLPASSGLLAALLFALGAKQTAHLQHWNFAASTCWWPFLLAGLEGFRETGRGRWLLVTALAAAFSWLGGSAQMAYLGTLLAAAYALWLAPGLWRRRPADALLALLSAPLGLLLAGPQIAPALELAALGPRGAGVDYRFATSWKWPDRWGLALLLLPRAFADGGGWGRWEMNLWEATGYLGILPLGLVAAAPLRRRATALFALLALLGVWLGFGEDAWLGLHRLLFDLLPGFGAFRNPTRTLMATSFASALLAAEGLAALHAPGGGRRAWWAAAVLAGAAGAALLLPRLAGFPHDRAAGAAGAVAAALLALAGLLWLALRGAALSRPWLGQAWALAAAALCGTDLHLAFGGWNDVAPAAGEVAGLGDLAALVPPPPGPRRVAVVAKWGRTANAPLRRGWEGAAGYGPTSIERVRALLEASADPGSRLAPPGLLTGDPNFPRPRPDGPLWPLFAAPLVVADEPLLLPRLAALRPEWELATDALAAEALPRVFWTRRAEVHASAGPDLDEALLRAARGELAVLAEPAPGLALDAPAGPPVAAAEVRIGPDRLEARLDAPADGLAVILDPWFPGWSAEVDGAPAPLLRADHAFLAVPLRAGPHRIALAYQNAWLGKGLALSGLALAGLLGALLWRRRARPEAPAAS